MEATVPEDPYTMSKFMNALIASLVLKGVREVSLLGTNPQSNLDRRGTYAMLRYAEKAVKENMQRARAGDRDAWLSFLVRVRNMLGPDNQGTFVQFRSELIGKISTLVSINRPHDGTYIFEVSKPHAESILQSGHPNLLLYVENLATVFLTGREQKAT